MGWCNKALGATAPSSNIQIPASMPTLGVDKPEAFPIRDLPTVELPSKDQTAILQALTNLSVAGSAEHLRNAYIQQKQSRQDIYGNVLNRRPVPRRFSWQDEVRFMESGK